MMVITDSKRIICTEDDNKVNFDSTYSANQYCISQIKISTMCLAHNCLHEAMGPSNVVGQTHPIGHISS